MRSPRALIVPSLAVLFLAACQSDRGLAGPDGGSTNPLAISASISDGANGGSLAVWYLPPLVPDPSGNPDFEPEEFKDDLTVVTRIFLCDPACPATPDGGALAQGPATVEDDKYKFQWKAPANGAGNTYRAFTIANGVPVAFIDLLVNAGTPPAFDGAVVSPNQMANIHVMIEEVPVLVGLECNDDVNQCQGVIASEPTEDAVFDLEDPDDDGDNDLTLQIPAGTAFEDTDGNPVGNVTFSLGTCGPDEDLDADLRFLGDCFEILTFVDGVQTPIQLVGGFATVSICDLNDPSGLPPVPDPNLVSIIHFENGVFAEALEHTTPVGCDLPVAAAPTSSNPFARLASAVSKRLSDWLGPRPALATSVALDIGGGGKVDLFESKFRGAIMSKIVPAPTFPTDEGGDPEPQLGTLGSPVLPAPAVQVLDAADNPVPGAFVRFQVLGPAGNARVADPDSPGSGNGFVRIMTDANGIADATWTLLTGSVDNPHELRAFAAGMNAGFGTAVLQPIPDDNDGILDNVPFGGPAFCGTNTCVDPSGGTPWILGEEIIFEADGGTYQIAFHRGDVPSREIWTLLTDGTGVEAGPVQLVNTADNDENPKWSRAGDRIAFMSDRTGFNEIWVMDPDGSAVQITSVGQAGANRPHSWGPGDAEITFTTTRNGLFQIARQASDGSGAPFFIRDNSGSPDWSPDGQWIATEGFVSDGDGGGSNQIVIIKPDGTGEANLSANFIPELRPDWSPDGTRIAFTQFDPSEGAQSGDIWVMDVDFVNGIGINRQNLTPGTSGSRDQDPVWSPDGQFIAFFSDRADPGNNFDLYIMAADGTGVVRLTTDPAFDGAPDFRY